MSYAGKEIAKLAERILFDRGYSIGLLCRALKTLPINSTLSEDIAEFLASQGEMSWDEFYAAGEEAAKEQK